MNVCIVCSLVSWIIFCGVKSFAILNIFLAFVFHDFICPCCYALINLNVLYIYPKVYNFTDEWWGDFPLLFILWALKHYCLVIKEYLLPLDRHQNSSVLFSTSGSICTFSWYLRYQKGIWRDGDFFLDSPFSFFYLIATDLY